MRISCRPLTVLAVVAVLLASSCSESGPRVERSPDGRHLEAGSEDVKFIQAGDCLKDQLEDNFSFVYVTPCEEPHSVELISAPVLPFRSHPGSAIVEDFLATQCQQDFVLYTDLSLHSTQLFLEWFYPSRSDWESGGETTAYCAVVTKGSPLSGSVAGQGAG